MTFVSRILGLVRDVMMFQMLGFGWAVGTFATAWMVPNLLRRLFGEGALSASFIPLYTRLQGDDPAAGRRLIGSVTGMLLLLLGIITVVVVATGLCVPPEWVGKAGVDGSADIISAQHQGELLLELTVILFPYAIPICLAAIFAGALNAHGIFMLPAASPIVLNLVWIGGLGFAVYSGLKDPAQILTLVAICLLAGGVAQMCLSLVPLWRRQLLETPSLPRPGDPSRQVLRNMGPTIVGMSLVQINTLMDTGFAYWLVDSSGPSFIWAATRLQQFPLALTALALATAVFPRFSKLGGTGDRSELRKEVDAATRYTLLMALPAAVGMILVAQPLIDLMFASDRSTAEDLATANLTTIYFVAALPAIGVAILHVKALYAINDYQTPKRAAFWLLILNLILNLVFVIGFGLGIPGLALATSIASFINAFVLRRKVTSACPGERHDFRIWQTMVATAAMAAAVLGTQELLLATSKLDRALFDLALPIVVGIAVYGGIQFMLGQRTLRMR